MSTFANEDSLAATSGAPVLSLFSLRGRNALITGGSRGIGQGMALALAQAGAHVILAQRDISNTATKHLIDAIPNSAGCTIVSVDLNSVEDSEKLVSRVLEIVKEIHILVNCGGMLIRDDSVNVNLADWNTVLNVNLSSLFAITSAAGRHMIPLRRGKIINVTSLNAFVGGFRVASYSATKGAVEQLTKALSNEWAKYNITVNSIAPGSIATDINSEARKNPDFIKSRLDGTPGGRWGTPSDFAGVTVFLASDASQFVTGQSIVVDGVGLGSRVDLKLTFVKGALAKGPI